MDLKFLESRIARIFFLLLFGANNVFAANLSLPGDIYFQYDRDVENHTTNDIQNGRIMGTIKQGVQLDNSMFFVKVNVYNPLSLLIDRDNFYSFGVSQQVEFVEFGIAKEFVRYSTNDYNRYCAFINIRKQWDLKQVFNNGESK